ncbi:MAG: elongation factor G [Saprospiraceae bacterium]|nr:elongation factor G [Saprospiraceae bacterium]
MALSSKNIRNICLLGHSGSGKTTFAETMLFESGAISRRGTVEAGSTVSDFTNIEKERGNTVFSTLMHAHWKDSKINILDTPGLDDFVGEVVSSLKVCDTALMIVNSAQGVEVSTELVWEYVQDFNTPSVFVVNQIDHDKSNFEQSLEQIQERFGNKVLPVQYPLNQGGSFNTIVDALRMTMYVFSDEGGKPEKVDIPDSEIERAQEMHNALVEAAAENDETLMEKFFEAGSLNEEELAEGLTIALANQQIYPVFCCSASQNKGSGRIMGFLNDIAPSPVDRPEAALKGGGTLACDSSGDSCAFIFKSFSEPQVGMVSYFKVYAGTIKAGDDLVNASNRTTERLNQLFVSEGKTRSTVDELIAGDIGCTVKLKNTHTNNTITTKGAEKEIEPIHFPKAKIRVAVTPPGKNEMEKLMKALHQLEEEDPTLIVEQSSTLKQTILHGQGQLHIDLVKYRVEKVNGIAMDFEKPKIPYRETITTAANESYRHKKQSGGAGQFGEVHMRIEPYYEGMPDPEGLNVRSTDIEDLPWGGKLAFYWCIVGGSIDSKYINAIKKGILNKMDEGPLIGSNCQNIRVCIYDGKMHSVDSNDMAFMIASSQAFKNAFQKSKPQLLEPIYNVDILCSDESMGDIMSDLQTRRAIIQGMDAEGHYQKISVKVPLAEMYKYNSTLRSLSQGKAKYSREFSEYAPVPHEIQQKLIAEANLEEVEA